MLQATDLCHCHQPVSKDRSQLYWPLHHLSLPQHDQLLWELGVFEFWKIGCFIRINSSPSPFPFPFPSLYLREPVSILAKLSKGYSPRGASNGAGVGSKMPPDITRNRHSRHTRDGFILPLYLSNDFAKAKNSFFSADCMKMLLN